MKSSLIFSLTDCILVKKYTILFPCFNDYYEQVGADSCVYHKGYLALLHNLVQSNSVNTDNDGA